MNEAQAIDVLWRAITALYWLVSVFLTWVLCDYGTSTGTEPHAPRDGEQRYHFIMRNYVYASWWFPWLCIQLVKWLREPVEVTRNNG